MRRSKRYDITIIIIVEIRKRKRRRLLRAGSDHHGNDTFASETRLAALDLSGSIHRQMS